MLELLLAVLVPPPQPPWTNILPAVTVTLLQYCLVESHRLSRKQDEAYLCGNRKEIITAAHLLAQLGKDPLVIKCGNGKHRMKFSATKNCAHNRKKLLIASNDRDGAAANRLHGTESDLYRGRL